MAKPAGERREEELGVSARIERRRDPLATRLFALMDVWDALRSDRPYRNALPQAKVLEYIRDQAGSNFDPALVNIFIDLIKEAG